MSGAVVGGHIPVLDFDQHLLLRIDENGPEGMIAMGEGAPGDVEATAQELLVKPLLCELRRRAHQCPAM